MTRGRWTTSLALLVPMVWADALAVAQEQETGKTKPPQAQSGHTTQSDQGTSPTTPDQQMKPEDAAQWMAWMEAAMPGPYHVFLKPMEGSWTTQCKWRMGSDDAWMEFPGKVEMRWVLGDRFLQAEVEGPGMFGPEGGGFRGLGFLGYDKAKEKYISIWMDNMGTGVWVSEGTCNSSGTEFELRGEYVDPATKQPRKFREVFKIVGDDELHDEMYDTDEQGKEFLTMEVHYKRS